MARRGVLPPACLTPNGRQRHPGRDGAEKRLSVSAHLIPRRPAPTPYFEMQVKRQGFSVKNEKEEKTPELGKVNCPTNQPRQVNHAVYHIES